VLALGEHGALERADALDVAPEEFGDLFRREASSDVRLDLSGVRARRERLRLRDGACLPDLAAKHVVDLEGEALSVLSGEDESRPLRAHDGQLFHPAPLRAARDRPHPTHGVTSNP
jgi:hypothetical protein